MKALLAAVVLASALAQPLAAQAPDTPADAGGASGGASPSPRQDEAEPTPPVRFLFPNRPSLRFGSVLRVDFRLKLQGDFRSYTPSATSDDDGWELNRRRIGVQGNVFGHVQYEVERELRRLNPWRDAFLNVSYFDDYQVQFGKFKMPFSQEELTGPTDLDFIHRATAVDALSPARDVGITLHGRFNQRAIGYDVGVFRSGGENSRFDVTQGEQRTAVARLAVRPLRLTSAPRTTREMEIAVAVTAADVPEGLNSLRGRTVSRDVFFQPIYVNGRRLRVGVDADWRPGPFSVKAEFIRVSDERRHQGVLEEHLPPLVAHGWYVSGTWALTGESKFNNIGPRAALFRGGAGALELAARYERLGFGSFAAGEPDEIHPRAANLLETSNRGWTFGLNWYVNHWTKIQMNVIRESLLDGSGRDLVARAASWTRVWRLQFVM